MRMPIIKAVQMDKFMMNKCCPYCDYQGFVVKKDCKDFQIWYCAACEKKLLKEKLEPKQSLLKRLLGRG